MADLGADVIKIESAKGDPLRYTAPSEGRPLDMYENTTWDLENGNKRCISLNMKTPEGKEAFFKLLDSAVELLRTKHKNGEAYYWLLYYSFLSPQQLKNVEEIIETLRPHIRDISFRTYYRKRREAIEALSSVLWGYTSKDSLDMLEQFFPETKSPSGQSGK